MWGVGLFGGEMSNQPIIDKVQEVTKVVAIDFLVDKVLVSWLGITSGPLAYILRPLAKKAAEATLGNGIDYVATEVKYYIDKKNGKILVRAIMEASDAGDKDAWDKLIDNL